MALFKVLQGDSSNLPATLTDGFAWYTTDDNKFYIDSHISEAKIGDGLTTSFTLINSFRSIQSIKINDVLTTDYTYNNSTHIVTFNNTSIPPAGSKIIIIDGELTRRCINPTGSGGSGGGTEYTAGSHIKISENNAISTDYGDVVSYTERGWDLFFENTLGTADTSLFPGFYLYEFYHNEFNAIPRPGSQIKVYVKINNVYTHIGTGTFRLSSAFDSALNKNPNECLTTEVGFTVEGSDAPMDSLLEGASPVFGDLGYAIGFVYEQNNGYLTIGGLSNYDGVDFKIEIDSGYEIIDTINMQTYDISLTPYTIWSNASTYSIGYNVGDNVYIKIGQYYIGECTFEADTDNILLSALNITGIACKINTVNTFAEIFNQSNPVCNPIVAGLPSGLLIYDTVNEYIHLGLTSDMSGSIVASINKIKSHILYEPEYIKIPDNALPTSKSTSFNNSASGNDDEHFPTTKAVVDYVGSPIKTINSNIPDINGNIDLPLSDPNAMTEITINGITYSKNDSNVNLNIPSEYTDLNNIPIVDNTVLQDSPNLITSGAVHSTIYSIEEALLNACNGKCKSYVYDTVADLDDALLDSTFTSELNTGDVFLIRAVNVPDYWWDSSISQKQILETTKVDLTDYVTQNQLTSFLAQAQLYIDTKLDNCSIRVSNTVPTVNDTSIITIVI